MDILLLTVGKTNTSYINAGIEEFKKRLKRYIPYHIECIPDIKTTKNLTPDIQKEKEGESILSHILLSDFCILLDEKGKEMTSSEFASYLQKIMLSGRKRIVFVIGGPYGFSKEIYKRADQMISMSRMTFTHEMVRLFFTEQIYRAMTILRGEPYHHD